MKKTSLLLFAAACLAQSPAIASDKITAAPAGELREIGFQSLKNGSGPTPKPTDSVTVHYRGTLPDGTEFDSSKKHGKPATFQLNQVIPCWTKGVQLMRPGGRAKLICPGHTAYGQRGVPGLIGPNATLIFDIELLSISQ